ncbi:MAG: ROK family protein [Actinobacteria bacterium]|nr:ROK family protein [Actinomycetota bacterium]
MQAIGIDVGGSGVKAALVDIAAGEFVGDRVRVDTPQPATPDAVVVAARDLIAGFPAHLPVGIGFPAPVIDGVTTTAANVDAGWVGAPARDLFTKGLGRAAVVVNDADAAGVGEARHGAARGEAGVVLLLTLGTGIGSALLSDGVLVPNTELGHLQVRGHDAEHLASAAVREHEDLSWDHWAERLSEVIGAIDALLWPDLVLLGGGVSRKSEKFIPLLHVRPPVRAAALRNQAGIIGAACLAADAAR